VVCDSVLVQYSELESHTQVLLASRNEELPRAFPFHIYQVEEAWFSSDSQGEGVAVEVVLVESELASQLPLRGLV
jgi:hypothetical protein